MNDRKNIRILSPIVVLAILFLCFSLNAQADVIEKVSVEPFDDYSVVKVSLARRLTYRMHTPTSRGDLLVVEMIALDGITADPLLEQRQSYPWQPTRDLPLRQVVYDRNLSQQPTITFRFATTVRFDVSGSADGLQLNVTVYNPTSKQKGPAAASSAAGAAGAAGALGLNGAASPEVEQQVKELMRQGRIEMAKQNYVAAIANYDQVLNSAANTQQRQALEFKGLAEELTGQSGQAKASYEKYLQLYPEEGPDAERVNQRLQSLVTAGDEPRESLRASRQDQEKPDSFNADFYGSFSNFYNRFVVVTDNGTRVSQSAVQADLFLTGNIRTEEWDIRANFAGGQLFNTLDNGPPDTTRITNGYLDLANDTLGFEARLGRQIGYTGGILGRFDGVKAGYMVADWVRLNAVVGFPVEYSSVTRAGQDNIFYGINADFLGIDGPFDTAIDFNTFFIQQFVDGTQDRLAVGGSAQFSSATANAFSLLDYDLLYNQLNILSFNGNWRLPSQTNINMLLEYRKSPILTTSNALLGAFSFNNIRELLGFANTGEIRELARRNTSESMTGTLGFSQPISDKFQISGDFTATKFNSTQSTFFDPNQGGANIVNIDGIAGFGWEYFASAQIFGNNLITSGDLVGLDLRYASLQTSNRYGIVINTRYPFSTDFDIAPRFRVDYRAAHENGVDDWTFAPSMRMRYRLRRWIQFEAEVGGEFVTHNVPNTIGTLANDGNYYIIVGYRIDFDGTL